MDERQETIEAAQICGEIGEIIGREAACKQSVTDCNRFGNAAKMPHVGYGDRFYVVPYKAMEVRP